MSGVRPQSSYDQYSTRAFEVSALDYVLKPVDPARLAQALDRVRERLAAASAPPLSAPTDGLRVIAQSQVFLKDGET